jgi:hypothetical protein
MESKSGNKIKVRIVRHGGEKDIINDVTPNLLSGLKIKVGFTVSESYKLTKYVDL